jgi:phosphatidate cytidylyltransferase
MSNILLRTITGAAFITVIILGLYWTFWSALIIMGIFSILGLWEFYTILQQPNKGPERSVGTIFGGLMFCFLALLWIGLDNSLITDASKKVAVIGIASLPFIILVREIFLQKEQPLNNVALTLFGWFYVLLPLFALVVLRGYDNVNAIYPIGMLLIVWTNDTFAYLTGRFMGKTPLFERISPKKTWEGTVGGIVFSVLVGVLISHFSGIESSFWIIGALIISPAAILGDLFESLLKRSLGIKDSGTILPGHGGILDRFDATLFAAPLFFIFYQIYF